jgi:hypothetical protein
VTDRGTLTLLRGGGAIIGAPEGTHIEQAEEAGAMVREWLADTSRVLFLSFPVDVVDLRQMMSGSRDGANRMTEGEVLYPRDLSSDTKSREVAVEVTGGHVHRGINRMGVLFLQESCNVDDSAHRRQLTDEEMSQVEPWRLCGRPGCWPEADEPTEDEAA